MCVQFSRTTQKQRFYLDIVSTEKSDTKPGIYSNWSGLFDSLSDTRLRNDKIYLRKYVIFSSNCEAHFLFSIANRNDIKLSKLYSETK